MLQHNFHIPLRTRFPPWNCCSKGSRSESIFVQNLAHGLSNSLWVEHLLACIPVSLLFFAGRTAGASSLFHGCNCIYDLYMWLRPFIQPTGVGGWHPSWQAWQQPASVNDHVAPFHLPHLSWTGIATAIPQFVWNWIRCTRSTGKSHCKVVMAALTEIVIEVRVVKIRFSFFETWKIFASSFW